MSERDHYESGVPCWVDILERDPQAAMRFYGGLFAWEFAGPGPGEYFVARLRRRDVAGIGATPQDEPEMPTAWNTYVAVESVDEAVGRAAAAGGTLLAGPIDAAPAGRLAVIIDPVGAAIGAWQPEAREGAQLVNEPSAWAMSVLHTDDPEAAHAFYGDVFGWQAEPFDMGGAEGTLWRLPGYLGGEPHQPVPRDVVAVMLPLGDAGSTSHWSVGFWIADVDEAAARVPELGGSVISPPRDVPGFRSAMFADPHGAAFSVSTLKA